MSISKKLISNTVYLFLDWFVLTLMGFLYWFIAGKTLLPEEYGIISTSTNLAMVLSGVSLLGLNVSVMKLLPEYLSKKQNKKIPPLIKFSLKTITSTNLILTLVLLLFSVQLASLLKVSPQVIWISTTILLTLSFSAQFGSIIYGFQEMRKFFTSDFFGQLTKVIVSALLILLGFRYFGPLIGFLLGFMLIALMRFKLSYPYFSSPTEGAIDRGKIMFDYAFPAFTSFLAWTLFLNGQYVLLTILQNPQVTGIFTIAMVLTSIIATFPNILAQALFPIISFLSTDKSSKERQARLIQLVFRYGLFLTLPLVALLLIFPEPIILIFSRAEYLEASQLFPILITGSLAYGLGNIFLSSLYAMGKTKIQRNIVILTTLTFLLSALPLTSHLAGLGMALAYALAVFVLASTSFFYVKKFLRVRLPLKSTVKLLIAMLISFSFLYVTTRYTTGVLDFLLAGLFGVIYLLILIPLKFYAAEDVKILEFISEKVPFKSQLSSLTKFLSKRTKT